MEMIELARLMPGAQRIHEGRSAKTWRGTIDTAEGEMVAYIKTESEAELIADAVGACVGRRHGLNIPKPYWVYVDQESLPGYDGQPIAFALLDARGVSFKQWFRQDSDTAWDALRRWPDYQSAAIFDEWIANTDRNLGNLLFDGDIWLIDHGHALGGPSWLTMGLDPAQTHNNDLLELRKAEGLSQHECYQWRKTGATMADGYDKADLSFLIQALDNGGVSPQNAHEAVSFLQNRAKNVVELLCHKLGIPELPLSALARTA